MIRLQFFPDNSLSVNKSRRIKLRRADCAFLRLLANRHGRAVPSDEIDCHLLGNGEIYEESVLTKNAWDGCVQVLSEAEPGIDWETRIAKFDMYGYGLFLGPLSEVERVRSTLPRRRVRLPSGQIVERPVGPAIPDLRFRSRTKRL